MEETKPEKGSALFNLVMFVISSILKQMSCRPNYPGFFLFSFFFFFEGGGGVGEHSNFVYTRSLGAVFH